VLQGVGVVGVVPLADREEDEHQRNSRLAQ
jgi:hypothetical protein